MNPALLIILLVVGSAIFVASALAWVLGALSPAAAVTLAACGAALEAFAFITFVRQRQAVRQPKR